MSFVSANPMRATYVRLRERFGNKVRIQQSYLRYEHKLEASNVSKVFLMSQTDQNAIRRPLENFLGTNDGFVAVSMSVGIYKELELSANFKRSGNAMQYYYPDITKFSEPATGANVSESDALMSIWNGTFSMKANADEVIYQDTMLQYLCVPNTQQSSSDLLPSHGTFQGEQRIPFSTPVVFEGRKRNELNFMAAQGADTVQIAGDPETGQNYMFIQLYGFLLRDFSEQLTIAMAAQMLVEEGLALGGRGK